ncbi:hypothetical protein TRAPUB_13369 [Trametes pubescens]|uniref:CSC1/OSCA1-like 7TM region domain-containing protein n=1 Tax=Trametes pubescens TaxID=154538 RepID=A0A1M2W7V6_TRAPU|nr:hypothetical protein TRAPUB_13369 [Trametes pubescens]
MTTLSASSVIHLTPRLRRQAHDDSSMLPSPKKQWWTTSDGSVFLPTQTSSAVTASSPSANSSATSATSAIPSTTPTSSATAAASSDTAQTSPIASSATGSGPGSLTSTFTTFTTSVPVTVSDASTTFTTFSQFTITSSRVFTAFPDTQTVQAALLVDPVCIGDGVDASSLGEWFVQQSFRPKPLGRSFWAFLFPSVPLVPSLPSDVSDAGRSPAKDARLFPSDEQLSQRILWICTLIAAGWTVLALAGFLPLYMVDTPCLAHSIPQPRFTGVYSVLQDLSLLRLLHLLDAGQVTTTSLRVAFFAREVVDGTDEAPKARLRIIIATVLAIVLGLLPVLWKVLKEFNRTVAYRERWMEVRCQGFEMGWLSARRAPGFVGWGEKRLKDHLVKMGLSSCLDAADRNARSRRRRRAQELNNEERSNFEIDVQSLFSIGDTGHLALLIDERDEVLENLEVAETKYIHSFRLTTPDPSILDWEPPVPPPKEEPEGPPRPPISRPLPLASSASHRRRRRGRNPAYGSSSLPPTSYVMPYQFYKITDLGGISGGQFTDPERDLPSSASRRSLQPSFTDSVSKRVVGSRFQEVNRNSAAYGRLPLGSPLKVDGSGELTPVTSEHTHVTGDEHDTDPVPYGYDQHSSWDTSGFRGSVPPQDWLRHPHQHPDVIHEDEEPEDEWHDVLQEDPEAFEHAEEYPVEARRRPRPPRTRTGAGTPIEEHRETFPMRNRAGVATPDIPPPHLRLQPRQPFVRPISGLDHGQLGHIYEDIRHWRWKLKVINTEIAEVQRECYNDIADGARVKGWLMVGRGLRYLPGIQLIEGRAKEDIRWDELQREGDWSRDLIWWLAVIMVAILLGVGLTAVSGLAVALAPDVAHYLPFFMPIVTGHRLGGGIASSLAAAVAATLFISLAFLILHQLTPLSRTVSVSGSKLLQFKTMFYVLLGVAGIWLFATGAILFSINAFSVGLDETSAVANGAIYMSAFALVLVLNVAIIFPGLLLLQPIRLLKVMRAERAAVTPRQRFRAVYPSTYDPTYATSCAVLAIIFASAFALIFPLLAPAVLLLLVLTLIAHRFLVGYVYGRTLSQTGGLLHMWFLRRLGTVLAFQPLLLGLIFLSRRIWIEGGILCGAALFVVIIVESFCSWRTRVPGRRSLSPITQDSLATFEHTASPGKRQDVDEESTSLVSSARNTARARGSFASVLEMMSLTLAVSPSASESRGPVPLETENLDDLTATERAARTNPDAPPHLPPLPFADHAEEMAGVLYAPELLAPPPMIWLPNDVGGIARAEAYDLQRYHNLAVTLDVRAKEDLAPRRSETSEQSPHSSSPHAL